MRCSSTESPHSINEAHCLVEKYLRLVATKKKMIVSGENIENIEAFTRQLHQLKTSQEFRWALTVARNNDKDKIELTSFNQASFFNNSPASDPETRAQNPLTQVAYMSPEIDVEEYYAHLAKGSLDHSLCSLDNLTSVITPGSASATRLDNEVAEIIRLAPKYS